MPTLRDFWRMPIEEKKLWEVHHSSLIRSMNATYEQCRAYSCQDIVNGLTKLSVKKGEIVEIPPNTPFHVIGRVDTSYVCKNIPETYYATFKNRTFVSHTVINEKNISHYKGGIFFIYDLLPEDIVHIFPMDSDTKKYATTEDDLTLLPSIWITLSELATLSAKMGVYCQITAKTKRNGQIIEPIAVGAFNKVSEDIKKVADLFGLGILLLHPNKNAINYRRDLLYDYYKLQYISTITEELYGFSVISMYYPD